MKTSCEFRFFGYRGVVNRCNVSSGSVESTYTTNLITVSISNSLSFEMFSKVLLHELFEGALGIMGLSFISKNGNNYDAHYIFGHNELNVLSDEVWATYNQVLQNMSEEEEDD